MTDIQPTSQLTPAERDQLTTAEQAIEQGIQAFLVVGEQLLLIRDNNLYRETHDTFKEYMFDRWNIRESTGYEYMEGYQLVSSLDDSAPAEQFKSSFTRLLRKYEPQTQVKIYQQASVLAANEDTEITSRHIKEVIEAHEEENTRQKVRESGFSFVIQDMTTGTLSPQKALKVCQTLSECTPRVRADLLRWRVYNPELMLLMNRKRDTNTYKEAIASGHIEVWYDDIREFHQLALNRCNAHHFRQALDLSYKERQFQRLAENRNKQGIISTSCLVHLGDPAKTIEELINAGASVPHLEELSLAISAFIETLPDTTRTDVQ